MQQHGGCVWQFLSAPPAGVRVELVEVGFKSPDLWVDFVSVLPTSQAFPTLKSVLTRI